MSENKKVTIIGGGLAGSEAAYYLLKKGYEVTLFERRPNVGDGAHETGLFGELVCSNSLKSARLDNACGLLKEEMRRMGSLLMEKAAECSVPAGNALSVDRVLFAEKITQELLSFPNLTVKKEEVCALPEENTIVATGPLTGGELLNELSKIAGEKNLSFFDASAPIVKKDTIDFTKAYYKSRYEQDDSSYINCAFSKEEYRRFVYELTHAEKALLHEFDTHYFEGCLPIEVIASRGEETLRHGPLKPFGLWDENHPHPYAVCQLRQDTKLGDCYNLVGFQTNLTYPEQKRVFSMIPGLENAEFIRYGLMHRNSYLNAPSTLNPDLTLKGRENVYIAGQLSGVEGYVESAVTGIIAAVNLSRKIEGKPFIKVPDSTVTGALLSYLNQASGKYFAPMNANWALLPNSDKHNREPSIQNALSAIESYWKASNE